MCACVCLEGVHQEGGKYIRNEEINALLINVFHILGQECEKMQIVWSASRMLKTRHLL